MITLFTIPRAFTGGDKTRQENTLGSWTRLIPRPEIILFCGDPGVAEAAKQFDCVHVPDIKCNKKGIPYVSHVFRLASQMATNDILCYANADIIFIQDIITAAKTVKEHFNDEPFLVVGQRWNAPVPEPLEFTDGWQHRLQAQVKHNRSNISSCAIDYFMYSRGAVVDLPDFLVGSPKWDNWLVKNAEKRRVQIVSATQALTCIHQQHEHRWPAAGAQYNHSLWWKSGGGVGYVYSGSWLLDLGGKVVKKPKAKRHRDPGWVTGTVDLTNAASKKMATPRAKFQHDPTPVRPKAIRPTHAVPKDEIGLPVNVNIPAQELATSAKKLRQQAAKRKSARGKYSHSPSRDALIAEKERLQQIQDAIRAARIAARDARLADRRKKRGK